MKLKFEPIIQTPLDKLQFFLFVDFLVSLFLIFSFSEEVQNSLFVVDGTDIRVLHQLEDMLNPGHF